MCVGGFLQLAVPSACGSRGESDCWEAMAWWQEQEVAHHIASCERTGNEVRLTQPAPCGRHKGMEMARRVG